MKNGIGRATGEIVGILNRGVLLSSKTVVIRTASDFDVADIKAVFGDLMHVAPGEFVKMMRNWKSFEYWPRASTEGWHSAQPT